MQHNNKTKHDFTQFELSKLIITSHFFSTIKMSPSSRLILMVLCSHFPNIYPSIKTIQEESGIASKTSIINSLKELSKLGIIMYETKNVNHYSFTTYFFELLKVEPKQYNKCIDGGTKIEPKQINKQKINKFQKNKSNFSHITGIDYKKYKKPDYGEKQSPLDLNREQAIIFLNNLPKTLYNSYFAVELRKKWHL